MVKESLLKNIGIPLYYLALLHNAFLRGGGLKQYAFVTWQFRWSGPGFVGSLLRVSLDSGCCLGCILIWGLTREGSTSTSLPVVGRIHILVAVEFMTTCFRESSPHEREPLLFHISNFRRGLHPRKTSPDYARPTYEELRVNWLGTLVAPSKSLNLRHMLLVRSSHSRRGSYTRVWFIGGLARVCPSYLLLMKKLNDHTTVSHPSHEIHEVEGMGWEGLEDMQVY